MPDSLPRSVLCVDFGSTFTKLVLLDTDSARVRATVQHRTTIGSDLLDGYAAARAELVAAHPDAAGAPVLACSSAGGGLRIAVVGNEELVTAEAGRRVALSSGGRVVSTLSGGLGGGGLIALRAGEPDVVLLVGGTDGGNTEQLLGDAEVLAENGWAGPVVVAGDRDSQARVAAVLAAAGTPYRLADNVVPRIGVLAPDSARAAIRAVFLQHVIGGKHLSRHPEFAAMVLGATPDVVLTSVEQLAAALGGSEPGSGVVVVDVGGATTDVHSAVVPDPEEVRLSRSVVGSSALNRTVEGDLGMRWSAPSTAQAAVEAGLAEADLLDLAAPRRAEPGLLPTEQDEREADLRLARAAAVLAVRRHAGRSRVVLSPQGRVVELSGTNLRAVELVLASGGVFRAAGDEAARAALGAATGVDPDGWQYPEAPRVVVDTAGVLAAAGLLVLGFGPARAGETARRLLCNTVAPGTR